MNQIVMDESHNLHAARAYNSVQIDDRYCYAQFIAMLWNVSTWAEMNDISLSISN